MPQISQKTKDKVSEQILHYLFTISPSSAFTNAIASNIARDEEFTKTLLLSLEKKTLVVQINKNAQGIKYIKRQRWRLSNAAYDAYQKHQSSSTKLQNNNSYNPSTDNIEEY